MVILIFNISWKIGLRLEKRIEEAVPAGQQLQELGMRLRCDDSGSENVSVYMPIIRIQCLFRRSKKNRKNSPSLSKKNFSSVNQINNC